MRPGFDPNKYLDAQVLKDLLRGKKFRLDCGHFASVGHHGASNIVILNCSTKNGSDGIQLICTSCYD